MVEVGQRGEYKAKTSFISKATSIFLCLFLLLSVFSFVSTSYASTFTEELTPDIPIASDPLGNRTPLILVHGLHGRPGYKYWQNFVTYFYSSLLPSDYKLYYFDYDSDIVSVSTIGQYLANEVNTQLPDNKIVILAHSMGGLVARSYMQEYGGSGKIIKLITLATPHHGSPAANNVGRQCISKFDWLSLMGIADLCFWDAKLCDSSQTTGNLLLSIDADMPNRSDLRWDNYDNAMHGLNFDLLPCYDLNPLEINNWLRTLNQDTTNDSKIIAYFGYVDPFDDGTNSDPNRTWLINQVDSIIPIYGTLQAYGTLLGYAQGGQHQKAMVGSILMSEGMNNLYLYNDGLVPVESGSFVGHNISTWREFPGYDHADMKDGKFVNGTWPLFDSIEDDLAVIHSQTNPLASGSGTIITGSITTPGQVQEYPFTVTTPGKYVIYSRGTTATTGVLYDANYTQLALDQYQSGELSNFRIEYSITAPGTYYVEVKGYSSTSVGNYELHIEWPGHGTISDDHGFSAWSATPVSVGSVTAGTLDLNGDKDFFSFTVTTPGKYVIYSRGTTATTGVLYDANYTQLALDQYQSGELSNFRIEYSITAPGTYYVEVRGYSRTSTGGYSLHIDGPGTGSTADQDDHGFSAWSATPVSVGSVTAGTLDLNGDKDFFKFIAGIPGKYVIYSSGTTATTGAVYDANYTQLALDQYQSGELSNFRIEYSIAAPGTYYVEVRGYSRTSTGGYNLHIESPSGISLTGLSINGPSSVNGDSQASYSATASWSNGTNSTITPSWSENSAFASITKSGVLTTATVTSNQSVTITATFTSGGVVATASKSVTITVPPITNYPNLTPYKPIDWFDKIVVSNSSGETSLFNSTDSLYVDWAVINNGTGPALNTFYTDLYVDGALDNSWYATSLPANYYTYVKDFSIGSLSAGTHTIKIVVDPSFAIAESNETDNQYSKTINVAQACSNMPAKRAGTYYSTLANAYGAATNGDTIQLQGVNFTESLTFNRSIAVTLMGGYDCNYSTDNLTSVIDGAMTISSGTVTVDNLTLISAPPSTVVGTWTLMKGCTNGTSYTWYINDGGVFSDNLGGSGTWTFSVGQISLYYNDAHHTTYSGEVADSLIYMSGTATIDTGASLCWYAFR